MVSHAGRKNQRVKICLIAANCLNVFMHATKITQAAKCIIMPVTCLIERIQNSVVLCVWQLTKIFNSTYCLFHIVSNKAHFPYNVSEIFIISTPEDLHVVIMASLQQNRLLEKETSPQVFDQAHKHPDPTLCPLLNLTCWQPDFRLWY